MIETTDTTLSPNPQKTQTNPLTQTETARARSQPRFSFHPALNASRPSVSQSAPAPELLPRLAPNPALPEAERELDLLLRLWADTRRSIPDIAAALHRSMPSLMALLQRPDIRELIDALSELLDLRARQAALSKVPRALETLEAVLTEAAEETEPEPGSQAHKARQRASHRRNQRRLAANAILNHLRTLKYGLSPSPHRGRRWPSRTA